MMKIMCLFRTMKGKHFYTLEMIDANYRRHSIKFYCFKRFGKNFHYLEDDITSNGEQTREFLRAFPCDGISCKEEEVNVPEEILKELDERLQRIKIAREEAKV